MKKLLTFLACNLLAILLISQVPYTLSVTQETYVALDNSISINNDEIWTENESYAVFFDFDVAIKNGEVNSLNMNPGSGFNFPTFGNYELLFFHWPFGGPFLLDRGFGTDHSLSPLSYQIDGEEGNKIIKLQWGNAGFLMDMVEMEGYNTVTNEDYINFQVWIYEEDGTIEIRIGPNSVVNPDSYGNWNGGITGPYSCFIIGDFMIDFYGNADNPTYDWISTEGIVYGQMLNGIPSENIVYRLSPNFDALSMKESILINHNLIYRWDYNTDMLLIDLKKELKNPGTITIYSIDGRLIYTDVIENPLVELQLENVTPGIYITRLLVDNELHSFKFSK